MGEQSEDELETKICRSISELMNYEKKFLEMSRNNEVVLERCKALSKSLTQPAPVTKFNHLDSTQKIGKDDKSNDKLDKAPETYKFNYLDKNDKSNKLNKLDTAPEACKFKNCEFVLKCVNRKKSKIKQKMEAHIHKDHRDTKLNDGTPDKDVSTTLVLDSDHEEEALDTVNPFDPMASEKCK